MLEKRIEELEKRIAELESQVYNNIVRYNYYTVGAGAERAPDRSGNVYYPGGGGSGIGNPNVG